MTLCHPATFVSRKYQAFPATMHRRVNKFGISNERLKPRQDPAVRSSGPVEVANWVSPSFHGKRVPMRFDRGFLDAIQTC
jgi:hypothetical protein